MKHSFFSTLRNGSLNYIRTLIVFVLAYANLSSGKANTNGLKGWHLRHELRPLVPAGISGLKAVAFGNGSWVAASSSGAILSTPDPETVPWDLRCGRCFR